ncbi:MAG: hypothetical protein LWX56_11590 [Ignavibacteria bacterium]|nr:hypothetical protein [Ignavibacteria bacterium]
MIKISNNTKFLSVLVLGAALTRLLPHYPNFTAIGSIALFGGAYFKKTWQAFLIPFVAMLATDMVLGFHQVMASVYAAFALIVIVGMSLKAKRSVGSVALATVTASVSFFVITNFGMWAMGSLYPHNLTGLAECFTAAIPFFHYTLLGDCTFAAILFGSYEFVKLRKPALVQA